MIDGDLLSSFEVFGEMRNFTRAAKRIGVSQPALFERIRRLADATGVVLYERRGRELELTDAGRRVLAFAREHRAQHDTLLAGLRGVREAHEVVLAAGEGAYLYLLGPAIAKADVVPLTLGAPATLDAIRSGRAHLGVAVLDLVPPDIDAKPIVTTPLCVALPARHPLARTRKLALADLVGQRWILAPEGQLHRNLSARAITRAGAPPANVIDADGWPLMLKFVALGLGIAIVNGICDAPGVVLRPIAELGTVTYRLLTRRGAVLSPEAIALAKRIVALG